MHSYIVFLIKPFVWWRFCCCCRRGLLELPNMLMWRRRVWSFVWDLSWDIENTRNMQKCSLTLIFLVIPFPCDSKEIGYLTKCSLPFFGENSGSILYHTSLKKTSTSSITQRTIKISFCATESTSQGATDSIPFQSCNSSAEPAHQFELASWAYCPVEEKERPGNNTLKERSCIAKHLGWFDTCTRNSCSGKT